MTGDGAASLWYLRVNPNSADHGLDPSSSGICGYEPLNLVSEQQVKETQNSPNCYASPARPELRETNASYKWLSKGRIGSGKERDGREQRRFTSAPSGKGGPLGLDTLEGRPIEAI